MGFLLGLLVLGFGCGAGVGMLLPLPGRGIGLPSGKLTTTGIVLTLVAVVGGFLLALFGPVLFLSAVGMGSSSYEDVLFIWPLTMASFPVAFALVCVRWFRVPTPTPNGVSGK